MQNFFGIFTPLVTPIHADESPDLESLARLVAFQIDAGVHGLWVMGTSGEFAGFDEDERAGVANACISAAGGRVPSIVNVSDASTRRAIVHAKRAASLGADAVAATPPYYYPHSQDELLAHYRAIRDAVDVPLYIYNIPQTVRVRVEPATAMTLAAEGTASGIKDSQNDFESLRQLALFVQEQGLDFACFAGTRHLIDAAILIGAVGAIPSVANAFPDLCVRTYELAAAGDYAAAAEVAADIVRIEGLVATIGPGSRNAAVLGAWKASLAERGVISAAALSAPLRTPGDDEMRQLLGSLLRLEGNPAGG